MTTTLPPDERATAEAAERKRLRREFLASPHYRRWQRLRALQTTRLVRSIGESRPFFDVMRNTLTVGLLWGVVVIVDNSGALNAACEREFAPLVLAPLALAVLSSLFVMDQSRRLSALATTESAIAAMWSFVPQRRGADALRLLLWFVQVAFFVSVAFTGYSIAQQTWSKTSTLTNATVCLPNPAQKVNPT